MQPEVFDPSILSSPHAALGNGQHIPCAALAFAAFLCSVEFFPSVSLPKNLQPQESQGTLVNVMADGRCFWSACYVASRGKQEQAEWLAIARNRSGFPIETARQKYEDTTVAAWFAEVLGHAATQHAGDAMFAKNMKQIETSFSRFIMPEHEMILFFANTVLCGRLIILGKNFNHLGTYGLADAELELVLLSSGVKDGAGHVVPHFWTVLPVEQGNGISLLEARTMIRFIGKTSRKI